MVTVTRNKSMKDGKKCRGHGKNVKKDNNKTEV